VSLRKYDLLVNNLNEINKITSDVENFSSFSTTLEERIEEKSLSITKKNVQLDKLAKEHLHVLNSIAQKEEEIQSKEQELEEKNSDDLIASLLEYEQKFSQDDSKLKGIDNRDFLQIDKSIKSNVRRFEKIFKDYDANLETIIENRGDKEGVSVLIISAIFFIIFLSGMYIGGGEFWDYIDPNGKSLEYECPDGTVVEYDEVGSGTSVSDLEDDPPEHWCEEAVDWAIDKKETAIFSLICGGPLIALSWIVLLIILLLPVTSIFVTLDKEPQSKEIILAKKWTYGENYQESESVIKEAHSSLIILEESCKEYVVVLDKISNRRSRISHYKKKEIPRIEKKIEKLNHEVDVDELDRDKLGQKYNECLQLINDKLIKIQDLYEEISDMIPKSEF